jgi:hypothetical protein
MEDKLVDALYNLQPVLNRYKKLQTVPMNNEELAAFGNKVDHFCDIMKNWSKKSQKSSATWQQGTATEMILRSGHLIHFNDKVKVSYQGKKMEGGYETIQKCFIENDPAIPKHWAFAAKTQKGDSVTNLWRGQYDSMLRQWPCDPPTRAASNGLQFIQPNRKDTLCDGMEGPFGR